MNIISNAVKYNKEKGEILLSYYETQVDDRHILFEFHCKDTGVGMSKEFQNHIFEPFTQETGGARSVYGGTGLGMPITKLSGALFTTGLDMGCLLYTSDAADD